MDLLEIDAASHTGVDNVRENIIDNVRFFPHRSKFKVFNVGCAPRTMIKTRHFS